MLDRDKKPPAEERRLACPACIIYTGRFVTSHHDLRVGLQTAWAWTLCRYQRAQGEMSNEWIDYGLGGASLKCNLMRIEKLHIHRPRALSRGCRKSAMDWVENEVNRCRTRLRCHPDTTLGECTTEMMT